MKNTNGPVEKHEKTLSEIRELMAPEPSPCSIVSHQIGSRSEDDEWFGARNTDSARRIFYSETGHTPEETNHETLSQ